MRYIKEIKHIDKYKYVIDRGNRKKEERVLDYIENAKLFKAVADENRLKILKFLSGGEKCACVLLTRLDIGQPTLSHHMKILCDSGLVRGRREGRWTHYSQDKAGMRRLSDLIEELAGESDSPMKNHTESSEGCSCRLEKPSHEESEPAKTKLYVLTGFLGSGKTTLLLKLIERLKGKKIGVIQNEFGKLGIDGEILRNDDIQMVEINKGSIFCSCLKLKFVEALADMAKKDFDYLFVESSGLGDPSNMAEILGAVRELSGDIFEFSGALCLVDALNFFDELSDLETVYRQLKHCHLAVITKPDLVGPEKLSEIRAKIREINPVCRIDVSREGNLDPGFLDEELVAYSMSEGEESTNTPETKPKSLFLNFHGIIPEKKLEDFLKLMEMDSYRIKGFFNIEERGWSQVDVVGKRIDLAPCEDKGISQLVIISKIGPAIIKEIFDNWKTTVGLPMELKN